MRVVVVATGVALLAGCAGNQTSEPRTAAERFASALRTGQMHIACDALAPLTRDELESSEQAPCADALREQDLSRPADVVSVERFGRQAAVVLGGPRGPGDTWFLSRFDGRWLVVAAGCRPRGGQLPYDCQLEGA